MLQQLPGKLDFQIYRGCTFSITLTWNADGAVVDLTGYTAAMDLCRGGAALYTLSTANGRIALGGAAGTIALTISATDTAGSFSAGDYRYDLILTSGGGVKTPLLSGVATAVTGLTQ